MITLMNSSNAAIKKMVVAPHYIYLIKLLTSTTPAFKPLLAGLNRLSGTADEFILSFRFDK